MIELGLEQEAPLDILLDPPITLVYRPMLHGGGSGNSIPERMTKYKSSAYYKCAQT